MRKSLYIAVIGCGRLGSILASDLSQQGHEVVVIDRDKSAFDPAILILKKNREKFCRKKGNGEAS